MVLNNHINNGESMKQQRKTMHTDPVKTQAVEEVLKGQPMEMTAKKYGVHYTTLYSWKKNSKYNKTLVSAKDIDDRNLGRVITDTRNETVIDTSHITVSDDTQLDNIIVVKLNKEQLEAVKNLALKEFRTIDNQLTFMLVEAIQRNTLPF
jgi:transposase-like protein